MRDALDKELSSYFTDVEHLRGPFKEWVTAPELPKRLLVIHGVGGVGKSSLLRMFRLHCRGVGVPVALASGDDANTPSEVLQQWAEDLSADGVALSSFKKTADRYLALQASVEDRVQTTRDVALGVAGKAASKTAEMTGGAIAGAAIGSVVPGIGTAVGGVLGSVLFGMGADAAISWLHGFLKQSEIDLLLDPATRLTEGLLADLGRIAPKRRVVLMLDTFERMNALEDWAGELACQSPANTMFVISGRAIPTWNRSWPGWMADARVEELKPMTEEHMRELIGSYYATMRGGAPDSAQVDAIIRLARGLPIVVTSAVQLWVKYGVEDFQTVKPEIVADLVDRLMDGVPSRLIPALEAAAAVRWFDQPILRVVMAAEDVREEYGELRRFPFIRARVEGFALHDAVRELIDENLRVQDCERHRKLHERAADHFEHAVGQASATELQRLVLEHLYHRFRSDEEAGVALFVSMADEAGRFRLVNRLRAIVNDVNTYPLDQERSRLWREYFSLRLAELDLRHEDVREPLLRLAERSVGHRTLHAYVLADLGETLRGYREYEAAIEYLEEAVGSVPLDAKLLESMHSLAGSYRRVGRRADALATVTRMRDHCTRTGDLYGLSLALDRLEVFETEDGDTRAAADVRRQRIEILDQLGGALPYLEMYVHGGLGFIRALLSGRFHEVEEDLEGALEIASELQATNAEYIERDLAFVLALQGRCEESTRRFEAVMARSESSGSLAAEAGMAITSGFWAAALSKAGRFDEAEQMLLGSLDSKKRTGDVIGVPELQLWLGELYETRALRGRAETDHAAAKRCYWDCVRQTRAMQSRRNFECAALLGLARIEFECGHRDSVTSLSDEAELLAERYEYNNHLASLRLTLGHLAWGLDAADAKRVPSHAAVLERYQSALIHALRYNRFLLDEVLSGRREGTPLRPIVSYCLDRGEQGREILRALREWWESGLNDTGVTRPGTASPVAEGVPLRDAERIAREREPGDGGAQRSVVEQIDSALTASVDPVH